METNFFIIDFILVAFGFFVGYFASTRDSKPKQTTWVYCPGCKRDLTTSPNVMMKDEDLVYYYCGYCNTVSTWNFDAPVPLLCSSTYKDPNDWTK